MTTAAKDTVTAAHDFITLRRSIPRDAMLDVERTRIALDLLAEVEKRSLVPARAIRHLPVLYDPQDSSSLIMRASVQTQAEKPVVEKPVVEKPAPMPLPAPMPMPNPMPMPEPMPRPAPPMTLMPHRNVRYQGREIRVWDAWTTAKVATVAYITLVAVFLGIAVLLELIP